VQNKPKVQYYIVHYKCIAFNGCAIIDKDTTFGIEMTDTLANPPVKPNRMDRRREQTRAKLLDATLTLIIEKGVEKTTMDNITETADLGRRTLYYHFGGKEECIIAAVALSYSQIAEQADKSAHLHQDPALAFAVAGQLVMRKLIESPLTHRLIEYPRFLATAIKQAISAYVTSDLELGIKQGRFVPPADPGLLDTTVMWMLVGILIETIENGLDVEQSLIYFTAMHLVFLGLSREESEQLAHDAARFTTSG